MGETTPSTPRQAQRANRPSAGDSRKFAKPIDQMPGSSLLAALQSLAWAATLLGYANWVRRRYGSTIGLRDPRLGDLVYVADSTLVREIFQGEPQQLRAGEVDALREPVASPRSTLLLDEPDHMRVRSVGSKPGLRGD